MGTKVMKHADELTAIFNKMHAQYIEVEKNRERNQAPRQREYRIPRAMKAPWTVHLESDELMVIFKTWPNKEFEQIHVCGTKRYENLSLIEREVLESVAGENRIGVYQQIPDDEKRGAGLRFRQERKDDDRFLLQPATFVETMRRVVNAQRMFECYIKTEVNRIMRREEKPALIVVDYTIFR